MWLSIEGVPNIELLLTTKNQTNHHHNLFKIVWSSLEHIKARARSRAMSMWRVNGSWTQVVFFDLQILTY